MKEGKKQSVTVRIAGEEHAIRSNAEPDYTKLCAEYVDRRIHEIKKQVGALESHKTTILAALSITDELFQAQDGSEKTEERIAERISELATRLEERVNSGDE
ncbi:MAG: cell division protein ZapA [Gemmatimonadota bacterium]|nr:cell division protein ZapA [Gemmatimonadota bacterium]